MTATQAPGATQYAYQDVADMVREWRGLDEHDPASRRHRDAIIEHCLPLADNIARRYRNRGQPHEDLVQVARLGLVNAVDRFDPDAPAGFLAFAVPTITGEVRRYFRDHGWAVKVPRRMKELNTRLISAQAELAATLKRAPTATELAEHLDVAREEVLEGLIAANAYNTSSTDVHSDFDDDRPLTDRLGAIDSNFDKVDDIESVRPLLQALPEQDRVLLKLRFFENMTQTQIAQEFGVSQMQISRLLSRALATLRDQIE